MGSKRRSLTPDHCEIAGCEWRYQIQRHRILPGSEGGKYRIGNVIALCPNHHWLSDHAFISRDDLYEIVANRPEPEKSDVDNSGSGSSPGDQL